MMPLEVDFLMVNADWVVTCDADRRCIPSGALAVTGDRVVAVGPTQEIRAAFRGKQESDLSGFLVMPGLVNTHTHAAMSCFRGMSDDLSLQRWLHEVIFPAEARVVSADMVYWGTLLSIAEMLKNGITTFCDGYFFEEAAAQAVLDSGSRAVLGQGVLDFPTPDQPDPRRALERARSFLEAFPKHSDRLRPSIFCHAPYTCSAETLRSAKALCREHGMLFQIHLSETAAEVEEIVGRYGERPVFYLDRLGILDASTLCVHAVWLDAPEIDRLALREVGVSHNPESNMKLASGVAPLARLLAAEVRVGLGTDGCACNNDLDLFSEMDRAAKLQKVVLKDSTICPAADMLEMATRRGAAALGWGEAIGSIEAGRKADFIALDLDQPHLTPLYDPISAVVYAARGSDVRHVWVAGRRVVADGRLCRVDVARIMEEVRRRVRPLLSRVIVNRP